MRIWIDTLIANQLKQDDFARLIDAGHQLIVANTAIDVRVFQDNLDWFEDQLQDANIVIEIWDLPDDMMKSKSFLFSSRNFTAGPSETLQEAIDGMPGAEEVLEIAKLVVVYGYQKGDWEQGNWAPPEPLKAETAEILGIPVDTANRTAILAAAQKVNRLDLFDQYNLGYNKGLALQHCCDAIINIKGEYTKL